MPKPCKLVLLDQVNCKFEGLDPFVRREISQALKQFVPHARHTPAYRLGRWDGTISFATAGGGTFINLLDLVLPLVVNADYEIEIEDRRRTIDLSVLAPIDESYPSDRVWPEKHERAGQTIMLRDYQVELINTLLANSQSVHQASTGAGKTISVACLCRICEPLGRTMTVVPSKSLVLQTERDFAAMGLDYGVFFGDRKERGHRHTIGTWQSFAALHRKTRNDEVLSVDDIHAIVDGVNTVIVDEVHTAKGPELQGLLGGPLAQVPIRWGLTGTVPKGDWEWWPILCTLGPVVGQVAAKDLQDKGVLASCQIDVLTMQDTHVEFGSYHDEYDYLVTDKNRLRWIARLAQESAADGGNTLVLVDRIETGEFLSSITPGSVFIQGSMSGKKRAAEWEQVATVDGKVIYATFGTAAVGIDAPRLFNIFLLEAGKSFVRVIQSIGRGLRKAHDKQAVRVVDLSSSLKFSARHRTKRIAYYKEAGYPSTVTKVDWR